MGKVLGQLAIVLVYTRTVLKTQYKTQFFKDTAHFQLYLVLHPKAIVLNYMKGVIFSGCLELGPDLTPVGAANCLRRVQSRPSAA